MDSKAGIMLLAGGRDALVNFPVHLLTNTLRGQRKGGEGASGGFSTVRDEIVPFEAVVRDY